MNTTSKVNSPEFERLVELHLDGELSGEERIALDEFLAESESNREYFSRMQQMNQMLNDLPNEPVPDPIRVSDYRPAPSFLERLFAWPIEFKVSMGMAMAVIVLLGGQLAMQPKPGTPIEQLVGSMASYPTENLGSKNTQLFSTDKASGQLSLTRVNDLYLLVVNIDTQEPVVLNINRSATGSQFVGFSQPSEGLVRFEMASKSLSFAQGGEQAYSVFFEPLEQEKDLTLEFSITSGDEVIYTGSVTSETSLGD